MTFFIGGVQQGGPIQFGYIPSDNPTKPLYMSDLATQIASLFGGLGFSATVTADPWGSKFAANRLSNQPATAVSGAGVTFNAIQDVHTEWYQTVLFGNQFCENVIQRNNVNRVSNGGVNFWSTGWQDYDSNNKDVIVKNNICECGLGCPLYAAKGGTGYQNMSHAVISGNFVDSGIEESGTQANPGGDAYTLLSQNVINYYTRLNANWPTNMRKTNNMLIPVIMPAGPNDLGNVNLGAWLNNNAAEVIMEATVQSKVNGDFRGKGTVLSTIFPMIDPYDGLLNLRDPTGDIAGPWSKGTTSGQVPTWPF